MNTRTLMVLMIVPLATLLTSGCSQAPKPDARPDWVQGQSVKYPSARFITGRGQADELSLAKDRARADLAKTFSMNVSEQSKDSASFSQTDAGEKNTLDASRNISIRTDQMLSGVEIADTWQDPQTRVYYALAMLSRAKADAALRAQIADLDAGTRAYLNQAQASNDLFVKIAAAGHAVDAQTERAGLQRELQVADITGRGMPPAWSLGKLQADKAALLARLKITAAATGADAVAVQKLLAGALADAGFTVNTSGDYTLTAHLDYTALAPRDGWYWISGSLQVTLDGAGQAHGIRRWALKVSGSDPALAQQRLMDQVASDLQRDIQPTVLGFASGNTLAH
ncbi:MAG TPA: LPP20 family lipoprotein [Gammaproteobacteria bacterium]|nr:LPP20 family lipoprotein [Gammaproteobacteria bacterium]